MTFATWNPGDSLDTTLSGGNLTATSASGNAAVRANQYATSGKFYWECTFTTAVTGDTGTGIAQMSAALSGFGSPAGAVMVYTGAGGDIWINGSNTGSAIGSITTGSLVGIAVDFGAELIWFRLGASGNWNGSGTANPVTGTGGVSFSVLAAQPLLPSASMWVTSDAITANFGASAFSGTAPSGFSSGFGGTPTPFDGEGSVFNKTNTNSATVTLTTSQSNDIITLVSYAENVTAPTITSISGGSLTFTQRTRSHGSSRGSLEVWWALAASPLSAVTFTINYSANFDSQSAIMIGWAGMASTAWDSNVSVPALQSSNASTFTPSVSGISTSSAPGGVLLFLVGTSLDSTPNSPTGFAGYLANNPGSGATDWAFLKLMFQPITAAITSQSYATLTPAGNTSPGGIEVVFDALANATTAVNVSITGVSSTTAVGTPTLAITTNPSITGVSSTSAVGTPTVSAGTYTPFGYASTAISSSSTGNAGANSIFMTQVTLVRSATVTAVLLGTPNSTTSISFKAVIYDSTPSVLLGAGSAVTSVASGYNRFPLAAPVYLAAGTYYVGYVCNSSLNVLIGSSAGTQSWFVSGGQSVSSPANPLVGGSSNTNCLVVGLEFGSASQQQFGWAPDYTNGITLSSSNTVATLDGARGEIARSIVTQSAGTGGLWYAEIVVGGTISGPSPGVIAANSPTSAPASSHQFIEFLAITGAIGDFVGTTSIASAPNLTYTSGDILGIAYAATSSVLWMNKNNGTWSGGSGTADPVTGIGGVSLGAGNWPVMLTAGDTAAAVWTLRDYAAVQSFTPPSGYSPWSSFVPNINVSITGVSSTTAVGAPTVGIGASVAVSGVASASGIAAPTLTINTNPSITGVSSTSGIGTPTVSEVVNATITGGASTSAIGTPTLSISSSVSLTGVASTTGIGTPVASFDASVSLTGIYATGVVAAVAVGISFSVALTGVVSTSSIGALVASGTLVGVVSTAAIGTPTLSISTNPSILVGVQSITALGIAQSAVEPLISGVASTSGIGTLTVSASLVNGVQSATGIGTLIVTHSLPVLVGQQIVCIPGFVQALSTGNQTNAAITGLQGTMSVGSLAVAKSIGITGVAATGSVGVITTAITKAGMTVSDLNVQSISGQEPDLGLTVRWSDTEGQSWSDSVIRTIGEAGEYLTSIQVRRMGMSRRGRVYELSWSAPNATALTGVTILFEDSGT